MFYDFPLPRALSSWVPLGLWAFEEISAVVAREDINLSELYVTSSVVMNKPMLMLMLRCEGPFRH